MADFQDFIHLHVHSQYSILDGQASVSHLVDKAMADGMLGLAITDHGNMMAIKEFFNYTNKVTKAAKNKVAQLEKQREAIVAGTYKESLPADDAQRNASDEELLQGVDAALVKQRRMAAFKPIFGCEMYVARNGLEQKTTREDNSGWHLVVLAKNKVGYHNLIKLVSKAWTHGFYSRPRTDKAELQKYSEGLIISTACIGGEIPQKILKGTPEQVDEAIAWYKNIWGEDFYLELQRHEVTNPMIAANREAYALQQQVNEVLLEKGKQHGVKVICTNDVHFVDEDSAEAHDRLICLSTGKDLDDPKRMLYSKQEWFKTRAEMNRIFADVPEALQNTIEILDKIETYSIDHGPIMPNFNIPESFGTEEGYRKKYTDADLIAEFTSDENGNPIMTESEAQKKIEALGGVDKLYRLKLEGDYLAELTFEGAKKRYGDPLAADVIERLRFELHIMKTMGFPGYFLIVQDYIRVAREQLGVSVGPGRGSAAGSAVAYCLWITQVDPIKYDLLFERFLNPDRISLPDIDIDFDDDGRGAVLNWVTEHYGAEKVAHIITYGTMATKSAIKDVARVQKVPIAVSNNLCKAIPDNLEDAQGNKLKMNISNALSVVKELREAANSNDNNLRDTIKYATMLEGNVRSTGVHACGIIICKDDISDWVPVSTALDKESGEKVICTQYEGKVIEETGLIKMDFLGLKTLSIIKEAVANVKHSLGIDIDIDNIRIDDLATYALYSQGATVGTFQFESAGMQKYLRELQPTTFEDLIAMNALYRPGPMQYIPDFIARKHGRQPIVYDLPCMEKYLQDTYGITVYQEQVMLLSREIADFTRGESDTLRKAMGKKLIDKLNEMYPKFQKGGEAKGYDANVLSKIWNDWAEFAKYAFNKSHATCYSWVAYQTAYLKANFPAQYMAGVLSCNLSDIKKIMAFMDETRSMNIDILGPDINESYTKFSVNSEAQIRFGLGGIKGVGSSAVASILHERKERGTFSNIFNFVERVNLNDCNKKNIESLVIAGAFDSFGIAREQFFGLTNKGEVFIDALVRYGQKYQADAQSSANSLFGEIQEVAIATPALPDNYDTWTTLNRLNQERDLIGIYLSAHPLDDYEIVLKNICNLNAEALERLDEVGAMPSFQLGGMVTELREGFSKNGNPFAIAKIEDYTGVGTLPLFGENCAKWKNYFTVGTMVYVSGEIRGKQWRQDEMEAVITNVQFLGDVKDHLIESITITLPLTTVTQDTSFLDGFITHITEHPGNVDLFINLYDYTDSMTIRLFSKSIKVNVDRKFMQFLNSHSVIEYKIN